MQFQGFSKQTSDFLWGLMFNNERTWFSEHKNEFEEHLNRPFKAFAAELTAKMNEALPNMQWQCHVSRIYRDARRLFGRGPYKERLWLAVYPAEVGNHGPAFWFEVGAGVYEYGMGLFEVTPTMMERFRKGIDANPERFLRLAEGIDALPGFFVCGEEYKRPKGDRGEIINKWYNRRWVGVDRRCDLEGAAFTPELVDIIADDYLRLMPMFDYLTDFYFSCGDISGK